LAQEGGPAPGTPLGKDTVLFVAALRKQIGKNNPNEQFDPNKEDLIISTNTRFRYMGEPTSIHAKRIDWEVQSLA
jgi:hypothetical protein